jgi:segregation and condensation protein A
MTSQDLPFEADPDSASGADEAALIVDVEGFEGPLDLLLTLARHQKVDLTRISILALADQYLAFVEQARELHLELAADYLVMAAWLAYLKSRLLIPVAHEPEPGQSAAEMASALAIRLRRLEAFRNMVAKLTDRAQLGRDVFARGEPEPMNMVQRPEWSATLYDLLSAYAVQRRKTALAHVRLPPRVVWSLSEARAAIERLTGASQDWSRLDEYLIAYVVDPEMRASAFASSFAATLEMIREGVIEVHQASAFAPIFMRKRSANLRVVTSGDAPPEPRPY